ncbi:hypothetical protein JCM9957A_47180 [Kineosporia succinea]
MAAERSGVTAAAGGPAQPPGGKVTGSEQGDEPGQDQLLHDHRAYSFDHDASAGWPDRWWLLTFRLVRSDFGAVCGQLARV